MSQPERTINYPEVSLLSHCQILGERPGGLIEGWVPKNIIYDEDVPVDAGHVLELSKSIAEEARHNSGTGQLSAILIAEVNGLDKFLIIDGFHRFAALKGDPSANLVYATMRPNSSEEEVTDLRILTAATHKSVQFARVIEWIEEAWSRTPWKDKITATQAFTMGFSNSTGSILGLTQDEAKGVKDWVKRKSQLWHQSASAVSKKLLIAQAADPELVKEARSVRSGASHRMDNHLTPAHLAAIVSVLPNRYEAQNMVAAVTISRSLHAPTARAVALAVAHCKTAAEVQETLDNLDWHTVLPTYLDSRAREVRRIQRRGEALKTVEAFLDIVRTAILNHHDGDSDALAEILHHTPDLSARLKTMGSRCIALSNILATFSLEPNSPKPKVVAMAPLPSDGAARANNRATEKLPPKPGPAKPPAASPHTSVTVLKTPTPEEAGAQNFVQQIRDYLNAQTKALPEITSRWQANRAERLLIDEMFSGDPILTEDIRDAVNQYRQSTRR